MDQLSREKSVVVTGACGLIGSCVVRYLNDAGFDQIILVDDIKKTDKWKNLVGKKFRSFLSRHELFSWLEGKEEQISAFIHLGACSDTMETDGDFLMENNFRYTVRLAEYALKHDKRFIYASSAATYGDGSLGFSDSHENLEQLRPLNLYGFSKSCFDVWAKQNQVLDRVVGLKYFNVFGPNEDHKGRMASMVYKMVPLVQKEGKIRLFRSNDPANFRDGDQCRDFIYVKDAARMTVEFLSNQLSGIFNIGSGKATTWNQLASAVFQALHLPLSIEYIDMPQELAKQYQNFTQADMSKYLTLTGKIDPCCFTIEKAVYDYVHSHLMTGMRW